jgi:ubiquinone/menaquinone biosynthesis C-methylase UbiE
MLFMNYGYHAAEPLVLQPRDEEHRYSIQLYHRVAGAIDLRGLDVLEVGSGRGGGAAFVMRYLHPRSVTAVDMAASAIDFCREYYRIPGLHFQVGDAEALPFPDDSFDALLNVESSICYQHPERFFAEVQRVLRPGGHFLYADIRSQEEVPAWEAQLAASGLDQLEQEDITRQVVEALDRDHERRSRLIHQFVPRPLRRTFREFAGVQGSEFFYGALARREKLYRRYLFRRGR